MIRFGHLQRISEYSRRIVIVVSSRIAVPPRRERFPTKRHNDLFSPLRYIRREPRFLYAPSFTIETKLPRAIEVQPIVPLDRSALPIRAWILWSREKKLARREH